MDAGDLIIGEDLNGRCLVIWLPQDESQPTLMIDSRWLRFPDGGAEAILRWAREQPWAQRRGR